MSSFECPFCGSALPVDSFLVSKTHRLCFSGYITADPNKRQSIEFPIRIQFIKCPACNECTIKVADDEEKPIGFNSVQIWPHSLAKRYPDYIPRAIRQDYEEAYAILELSPKASATLSRRCLQGIIRDFWSIPNKRNLKEEIDAIEDRIPAGQWKVLDRVRKIGNIGAHMEQDINMIVDIDSGEAEKLLKLIEMLIKQWYIDRHDQQELYDEIISISESKEVQRKELHP